MTTVRVKVIPRSPKNEILGPMSDGTLKVRIAEPPEKGRANEALCGLLAGHFGVPRRSVTIVRGHTSAVKLVRIG